MDHIFRHGMAYVALSRMTALSGLHTINLNPRSIYTDENIERNPLLMPQASTLPLWNEHLPSQDLLLTNDLKIASVNIENLTAHLQMVLNHYYLRHMDLLLLQETWLQLTRPVLPPGYIFQSKPRCLSYQPPTPATQQLSTAANGGIGIILKATSLH